MKTSLLSALFAVTVAAFAQGCAASDPASDGESTAADMSTADSAKILADVLETAKAPSNEAPGMLGQSSHVARITLQTAQGGMAHFISQSGSVSTADGDDLGTIVELGLDWTQVRDALVAGGAKLVTTPGANGASSSTIVASVECKQAIAPNAKPSCTVTPITMTDDDTSALMTALVNGGSDSLAGEIQLSTTQGGMAHFISQSVMLSSNDGKKLADLGSIGVEWKLLETALLDAGATWKTTNGANGATSSKIDASVSCHRAPKAICTVSPR